MTNTPVEQSKRLLSLDAFRGFTIIAMIIVNSPGSWEHVYSPLRHARWNGCTPTDLVFPFFLFIVGISIVLAYKKRIDQGIAGKSLLKKALIRTIIIFLIGLVLNIAGDNFQEIRIPGVLQRISIVYFACSVIYIYCSVRTQIVIGIVILIAYWLVLTLVPVPGIDKALLEPVMNIANWIDYQFIPGKLYNNTWDPEGILSTFPAVVSGISGLIAGYIIVTKQTITVSIKMLVYYGTALVISGFLWNLIFPFNKNLWTSSYVLLTSGLASVTFAAFILLVDVLHYRKWIKTGLIFGANALTAYILHYIFKLPFGRIPFGEYTSLQEFFMTSLSGILSANFNSLLWALIFTLSCFIPVWILYRNNIYIKI